MARHVRKGAPMNRCITALLLVAAGCSGDPAANSSSENLTEVSYDLAHTRPECTHEGHPDTWCTRDDTLRLADLAGMEARIKTMLDRATDPAKARITIAYFSFSNKAIYNKLCERGKKGIPIEGFFDQSYRTGMPAQLAQECQGPAGNNVRVHFLGQMSESP